MLSLFWAGAVLSAYLGYKLYDWWVPAAVAGGVVAGQFALFQMAAGSWGPSAQLLGYMPHEPRDVLCHVRHRPLARTKQASMEEGRAMSALQLDGHIVLVTGALGTLGSAMCKAIEAAGGKAIRSDLAARGKVDIALDVTKEEDWKAARSRSSRTHGRLDGLVNNAGIGTPGDVEQTPFSEWRRVMAVNADGVFLGCKYAMPLLAKSKAPSIVNISSASGIVGGANLAAYNASKGAVRLLTKSVALSGARKRPPVRCNSVHPAFIEGDMVDAIVQHAARPGQGRCQAEAQIPIGRLGQPQEVADAVVWLLSQASSFTTGSEVLVDGGLIAG